MYIYFFYNLNAKVYGTYAVYVHRCMETHRFRYIPSQELVAMNYFTQINISHANKQKCLHPLSGA